MKNNRGQALVEFIIVLPILLLIIMAIIDLGNIFTKKYSLENDLDIVSSMYKEDRDKIDNYIKNNNLNINYVTDEEFMVIALSKNVKVDAPILNNILGKNYKITARRTMYE